MFYTILTVLYIKSDRCSREGFEVLVVMSLKIPIFRSVSPCALVDSYRSLED